MVVVVGEEGRDAQFGRKGESVCWMENERKLQLSAAFTVRERGNASSGMRNALCTINLLVAVN